MRVIKNSYPLVNMLELLVAKFWYDKGAVQSRSTARRLIALGWFISLFYLSSHGAGVQAPVCGRRLAV